MTKNEETNRKTVAIDFDGVLNNYTGWKGDNDLSTPKSGINYFLKKISDEYDIVIFTCRDMSKVRDWLQTYDLDKYIRAVTMTKPKAYVYIDDRAITYNGHYDEVLEKLETFKTWWEK